jgi:hypothetical protein
LTRRVFDAGKKIKGRKRHILVDTLGLLLSVAVHAANIQDRDGVALVLDRRTHRLFPFIEHNLRRRWLSRAESHEGRGQDGVLDDRDRWTLAHHRRLRSLTKALDRRTHLCLAQPFPAPSTRFISSAMPEPLPASSASP